MGIETKKVSAAVTGTDEGRFSISTDLTGGEIDPDNLFVIKDTVELPRGGIFRYVDCKRYKKLNFLKVTNYPPTIENGPEEQYRHSLVAGLDRISTDDDRKSPRFKIKKHVMDHAGIKINQQCVLVITEETQPPYISLWSKKNWKKYSKLVKNNYSV